MWGMLVASIAMGILYLLLTLCLAEMASAISFSGGSFGYVRCTLGPFFGYLVGASEFLQNIVYVATCVIVAADALLLPLDISNTYRPLMCLLIYIIMIGMHSMPLKYYWRAIRFFAVFTMLVMFLYLFGAFPFMDFNKNALHNGKSTGFDNNFYTFTQNFYYTNFFYIGIEIVPLSCDQVIEVSEFTFDRRNLNLIDELDLFLICSLKRTFLGESSHRLDFASCSQ